MAKAKESKLILRLPRNIDLELQFVDPPTNTEHPQGDPNVAVPVEIDDKGNTLWNGCGCGKGNSVC